MSVASENPRSGVPGRRLTLRTCTIAGIFLLSIGGLAALWLSARKVDAEQRTATERIAAPTSAASVSPSPPSATARVEGRSPDWLREQVEAGEPSRSRALLAALGDTRLRWTAIGLLDEQSRVSPSPEIEARVRRLMLSHKQGMREKAILLHDAWHYHQGKRDRDTNVVWGEPVQGLSFGASTCRYGTSRVRPGEAWLSCYVCLKNTGAAALRVGDSYADAWLGAVLKRIALEAANAA